MVNLQFSEIVPLIEDAEIVGTWEGSARDPYDALHFRFQGRNRRTRIDWLLDLPEDDMDKRSPEELAAFCILYFGC